MPKVKRERCPKCGSVEMVNYMFVDNSRIRVYVKCAKCEGFVARYTIERYTSDKTYESMLRYLGKQRFESGRRVKNIIEGYSKEIEQEFNRVIQLTKENEEEERMEKIIMD